MQARVIASLTPHGQQLAMLIVLKDFNTRTIVSKLNYLQRTLPGSPFLDLVVVPSDPYDLDSSFPSRLFGLGVSLGSLVEVGAFSSTSAAHDTEESIDMYLAASQHYPQLSPQLLRQIHRIFDDHHIGYTHEVRDDTSVRLRQLQLRGEVVGGYSIKRVDGQSVDSAGQLDVPLAVATLLETLKGLLVHCEQSRRGVNGRDYDEVEFSVVQLNNRINYGIVQPLVQGLVDRGMERVVAEVAEVDRYLSRGGR